VRNHIVQELQIQRSVEQKTLLLKRSSPNNLYNQQKIEGELHRIGTERRALINLNYGKRRFVEMGYDCEIYEPGYQTIVDQIRKFQSANMVVGIRGAELANVVWLEEGCKVVVIDNFTDKFGSPAEQIAFARKCSFDSIHVSNDKIHTLDDNLLEQIAGFL